MKGRLTIIPVGSGAVSSQELAAPPALKDLQARIGGGYIEIVPGFKRYMGKPCVAFCDEDGKRKKMPVNIHATELWYGQMKGPFIHEDMLVGPIVIITGDRELMEEL
jgi:Domain of unknown function (DUF3846)